MKSCRLNHPVLVLTRTWGKRCIIWLLSIANGPPYGCLIKECYRAVSKFEVSGREDCHIASCLGGQKSNETSVGLRSSISLLELLHCRICMSDNSDSIRSHCNNSVVPCSIQGVFVLFFGLLSLTGKCYQPTTASMSRLLSAWAPFSLHLSTLLPSSTSQWVEPLFLSCVHITPIL